MHPLIPLESVDCQFDQVCSKTLCLKFTLNLCNNLSCHVLVFLLLGSLVTSVVAHADPWSKMAFCLHQCILLICAWWHVFYMTLRGKGWASGRVQVDPTPPAAGISVIVKSPVLVAFAVIPRSSSTITISCADSVGQWVFPALIFSATLNTCNYSIKFAALGSEYPFTFIFSATFIFVSGFSWLAMKKRAAFYAWSSTLYSFLFKDMLKFLLLGNRKYVTQTTRHRKRETITVKPHFWPCLWRLWKTHTCWLEPANNAQFNCSPQINNWCKKSSCKNMAIKICCLS